MDATVQVIHGHLNTIKGTIWAVWQLSHTFVSAKNSPSLILEFPGIAQVREHDRSNILPHSVLGEAVCHWPSARHVHESEFCVCQPSPHFKALRPGLNFKQLTIYVLIEQGEPGIVKQL